MGMDLAAENQELDDYHFGAFSWSWLIRTPAGIALGIMPFGDQGQTAIRTWNDQDSTPLHNDGYLIHSREAVLMASIIEKMVPLLRDANGYLEEDGIEKGMIRSDFLDKAEMFIPWLRECHGFRVH